MDERREKTALRICVIRDTPREKSAIAHLLTSALLEILEPLAEEIFVVTGNFPENTISNKKIHVLNVKTNDRKSSKLTRIPNFVIRFIMTQFRISRMLVKIARKVDFVIFYIGGAVSLLPMLTAKLFRKKTILILAGSASQTAEPFHKRRLYDIDRIILAACFRVLERINYALCDLIGIAIKSESIIHFMRLERYSNKVVPFGSWFLDINLFKIKRRLSERRNVVGYVGRLNAEKGVLEFAKAIPLILSKKSDARFLIVGDGSLMNDMKRELEQTGCLDKVDFVGEVIHEKLPEYMNDMRFHILPSYTEAFGGTCIEAMSCGAIAIASAVGGLPDIIIDCETGFLLKDNQPQTIADKLIEVWDYSGLDQIQANARVFVEEKFTYEMAVERCRKVFNRWEQGWG